MNIRATALLLSLVIISSAWLLQGLTVARGDDPAPAAGGFQELLDRETRRSLKAVSEYLAANPKASDSEAAAQWLFTTALRQGLEAEVVPTAEAITKQAGVDPALLGAARQVLALGLARSGKIDAAVEQFSLMLLGGGSRQQAARILPFAHALSTRARLAGDLTAARKVYEKLQEAFPLNSQIDAIVGSRLARLQLIGQTAPRIDAEDIDGHRLSLTAPEFAGKVVLIDFWATNCRPCLEEMPKLKKLYEEFHAQGFEIVGVSLDEKAELVTAFRERNKMPWRQVLAPTGDGLGEDVAVGKSDITKRYDVKTIPALVVVNRDGKVAQVDLHGNDLKETIVKLLSRKPAAK